MEVRTVIPLTVLFDVAQHCLIVFLMILLLLHTMRVLTSVLKFASHIILLVLHVFDPSFTCNLSVIREDVWLATVVTPVVGVLTLLSIVIPAFVIEWAPDCLKVENVEVYVFLHLMK